jgi:hypothetical protein
MAKKRLVIDLQKDQHEALVRKAWDAKLTLSNYIRKKLGLPLEEQGRRSDLTRARREQKNQRREANRRGRG